MTATLRDARAALTEQASQPRSGAEFAESVMASVRSLVAFDGYCLLGVDPCSGLRSFLFSRNGLDGVADRLARNEAVEADLNRYVDLARSDVPVGVMSATGHGEPLSPRLHEIVRPAGFTSELRLALRSEGRLWGALVLFRGDRRRPFSDADAAATLAVAKPLAAAIRRYPVRNCPHPGTPFPPGVVMLDEHNSIISVSDHARTWLDNVRAGGVDEVDSDDVLRVVYDVGLTARTAGAQGPAPVCRVRTTSGQWLVVQGDRLESGSSSIAVVLQPASLRQVLPAAAAWFGLTRREQDVLRLMAFGLPAKHMSKRLGLSVLTVNDHLGAIYRKAAVSGREELLARLS